MRITYVDRLWLAGGLIGALILGAIAWFLLISPQNAETAGLRDQQSATQTQIATLRHRLADLRADSGNLPQYKAKLQQEREALPTVPGLADFLRELQAAGDEVGVDVTTMTTGAATPAGGLYSIPLSLIAQSDSTAKLDRFVAQVQQLQPRATLVQTVRLDASQPDQPRVLSLSTTIFLAPQASPSPQAAPGG